MDFLRGIGFDAELPIFLKKEGTETTGFFHDGPGGGVMYQKEFTLTVTAKSPLQLEHAASFIVNCTEIINGQVIECRLEETPIIAL